MVGSRQGCRRCCDVDVQLLRSADWIAAYGLRVGNSIDLKLTEIDLDALARVRSIEDGPEVLPGEGAVVTGRFATRKSTALVRVTFEDGTQLSGTSNHPVWCIDESGWKPLGKLRPGQFVRTREGCVAVAQVELISATPPVYNIEVDGEHVYEVTLLGILVHNVDGWDCQRYFDLFKKRFVDLVKLGPAEREEFANLLKLMRKPDGFDSWKSYYAGISGKPWTEGMHAHHILFKAGLGHEQKQLVAEGMEILLKHGIDPVYGKANLVWAPNVKGQHTKEMLQFVVDTLKRADSKGEKAVKEALQRLGRKAADCC